MRIYGINIYLLMDLALFSDPHLDRCPQIIRKGSAILRRRVSVCVLPAEAHARARPRISVA